MTESRSGQSSMRSRPRPEWRRTDSLRGKCVWLTRRSGLWASSRPPGSADRYATLSSPSLSTRIECAFSMSCTSPGPRAPRGSLPRRRNPRLCRSCPRGRRPSPPRRQPCPWPRGGASSRLSAPRRTASRRPGCRAAPRGASPPARPWWLRPSCPPWSWPRGSRSRAPAPRTRPSRRQAACGPRGRCRQATRASRRRHHVRGAGRRRPRAPTGRLARRRT